MAEIESIVSKEAIAGIKAADEALTAFDKNMQSSIAALNQFTAELKKQGISYKELSAISKQMTIEKQKQNATQKEAEKILRESERAAKAQAATLAKLAAKEKEHNEALKLEVKTIQDAQRQNKALTQERNKAITSFGKQSQAVKDLNAKLTQNTEFMRANGTAAEKQRMNIGNYGAALNGAKTAALGLVSALGITAGLAGVLKLANGVIQSSEALSDKWAETTTGLTFAWNSFKNSIATSDFSNLITNMKEAIKLGKDYAQIMDELEDRRRGASVAESQIRKELSDLRIKMNDVNLTAKGRAAYTQAIIDKEMELAKVREDIAKVDRDTEFKTIAGLKNINEATVKEFIEYKKGTKEKVDAANSFIEKQKELARLQEAGRKGVATLGGGKVGGGNETVITKEQIRLQNEIKNTSQDIKNMALVLQKLSPAEIEQLTNKTIAYGDAQGAVSENVERYYKKQDILEKKAAGNIADITKEVKKLINEVENISESTNFQVENIAYLAAENEARKIATQLIEDEQMALLELQDTQLSMQYTAKYQGKTKEAIAADPSLKTPLFGEGELSQFAIDQAQVTADTTFQIIADSATAEFDLKMSLLEKEKEAKLSAANLTEAQKAKIEADYQKKAAKLKTEQFKKQKAADIIQAIINTALAVSKALPNVPLSIAAGIAGAAQVAVIASQKIPQFDSGTLSTPSEFIAGERRPEWMVEPSGRVQLVTKPTHFKNMAGATVIGGAETQRMLEQGITPAALDLRPDIARMEQSIVNTIRNKRELHISGSTGKITERQGNYNKEYFNRKIAWLQRQN